MRTQPSKETEEQVRIGSAVEQALLPFFENQDREKTGLQIFLIQEPEGTRPEGCEFRARLGYLAGLELEIRLLCLRKRGRGREDCCLHYQ